MLFNFKKQTHIHLITGALLTCIATTSSAFITVGSTLDCTYDNLIDANNDPDVFVRVTSQQTYSDSFTITKSKFFTGGYDTCADAIAGNIGQFKTKWRRFNDGTVVNVNANQASQSIIAISNFEIYGGKNAAFAGAGGINVRGNSSLLLSNSLVHNNEGDEGGGIRVTGSQARVTLNSSELSNNTGNSAGAGVYCENDATFTMLADSLIKANTTTGKGGGIFANDGCQVSVQSGDSLDPLNVQLGIVGNQASLGGGVYLKAGADMQLTGNNEHPASIVGNVSNIDTNNVIIGGGGVFMTGSGTTFNATNGRIDFNLAQNVGAGIGVLDHAMFTMNRLDTPCWDNDKCSSLSENIILKATGGSAAGYIYDQASANISQTIIADNKAENTSVIGVSNAGYVRLEGNLIVGNGPFNQNFSLRLFEISGVGGNAGNLDFFYGTIVKNNTASMFYLDGATSQQFVNINNSIIRDQGTIISTVGAINPFLNMDCNYVHEIDSLALATTNTDFFNLDPNFVDYANGDYHLSSQSLAQDLCNEATIQSSFKDLNGNDRGYENPDVSNLRGPFDSGAYEMNSDVIFSHGFE